MAKNENRVSTITVSFTEENAQEHRDFKANTAKKGLKMNEVLVGLIKGYNRQEK